MSCKVFVVLSEQFYGGEDIQVFNTATAKDDAEIYRLQCIARTRGKVDYIVKEVDLVLQ